MMSSDLYAVPDLALTRACPERLGVLVKVAGERGDDHVEEDEALA
jgi:hypothetical protein